MKLELLMVLMVLAAVALLPNLSEGKIVSRCELKTKLGAAISGTSQNKNTRLALIICEVEKISKLNTNLVTVEVHHKPKSTNQPKTGTEENANKPNTTANITSSEEVQANSSAPSGHRGQKHPSSERNEVKEKQPSQEKENSSGQGHEEYSKYGIFQLSDSEFCKSGNVRSQNKCHTNCSAFTDDNITDDIKCFVGQDYWRQILHEASGDCHNQTNTFFYQCN